MAKLYKYVRPSQKRSYDLNYHLINSDDLRLKAKVAKLVKIIPERYNCGVVFTKRRVWFVKDGEKFIQLMVGKQRIFVKIKTGEGWLETRLHNWEDFERVFRIIESQTWSL
jgi:hypothetical protein